VKTAAAPSWRRKEICRDDLRELGGTGSSIQAMVVFGDD